MGRMQQRIDADAGVIAVYNRREQHGALCASLDQDSK